MRYSLTFLLAVTTWVGTCLGVYVSAAGRGWPPEVAQWVAWLTWVPVFLVLSLTVLARNRSTFGLNVLATAALLLMLMCWGRLQLMFSASLLAHLRLHVWMISSGLFWAGVLLLFRSVGKTRALTA